MQPAAGVVSAGMLWQDKGERAPLCHLALHTDLSAKEFSEPLCNREPEPDPPVLPGGFIPVADIKWEKDGIPGLTSHAAAIRAMPVNGEYGLYGEPG